MATHRFRVGEKVQFLGGTAIKFATSNVYEIVQQLPESNGEYQYKIKSLDEPHLRGRKKASFAGRKSVWPPDVSFYRENFPCVCELIHTLTAEKGLTLPASQTRILPGSREGEE